VLFLLLNILTHWTPRPWSGAQVVYNRVPPARIREDRDRSEWKQARVLHRGGQIFTTCLPNWTT